MPTYLIQTTYTLHHHRPEESEWYDIDNGVVFVGSFEDLSEKMEVEAGPDCFELSDTDQVSPPVKYIHMRAFEVSDTPVLYNSKPKEEASIQEQIKSQGGFITEKDIEDLVEVDRLRQVLVRCGCGRFTCAVQDVDHFIGMILKSKEDYVRDVSLLAGDPWMN